MSDSVRIEGNWPAPILLTRGLARATARPWNDEDPSALLRLERGSLDFLEAATDCLTGMTRRGVYSPAIYPGSTRIWIRCGYEEHARLRIMERALSTPSEPPTVDVIEATDPDWDLIHHIDQRSFQGFWRMSQHGLQEALSSTRRSAVLTVQRGGALAGYAILGAQWGASYLQRIAVDPDHIRLGLGSSLIRGALQWARQGGSQTMVLNVRDENTRAGRLYAGEGFRATATTLRVLHYAV